MADHVSISKHYSLAQVVSATGAKRRSIQLWADGGVIAGYTPTDRAGTGVHRLFSGLEVQIAALLVPLARMGVPIGNLKAFAATMRPLLKNSQVYQPVTRGMSEAQMTILNGLKRSAGGVGDNFLCFAFGDSFNWISVKNDERGPVCINPRKDLPANLQKPMPLVAILDLDLLNNLVA